MSIFNDPDHGEELQPCEVCDTTESYDLDMDMPDDLYRIATPQGWPGDESIPRLERAAARGFRFGRVCGRCRAERADEVHALGLDLT